MVCTAVDYSYFNCSLWLFFLERVGKQLFYGIEWPVSPIIFCKGHSLYRPRNFSFCVLGKIRPAVVILFYLLHYIESSLRESEVLKFDYGDDETELLY